MRIAQASAYLLAGTGLAMTRKTPLPEFRLVKDTVGNRDGPGQRYLSRSRPGKHATIRMRLSGWN